MPEKTSNKSNGKLADSLKSIPNAFVFFGRAFKNAKKDFWVSIQVLFWVSIILSVIFYVVEHAAQPEEYPNWWQAIVWTFTRYIGDPGKFSGKGPITLTGRHIDTIIGILKILIFAVPAGLFANGFRKAMEDDKREKHMQECREKIWKSFRRQQTKKTFYRVAPRHMSLITLKAKKNMKEDDLVDMVNRFDEFRLRNLATSQTANEHPQDRLVIEMLPLNEQTVDGFPIVRTTYGIKIDRQSNVTIVAPTAATENSIGHIAYYLAQFGGFNYISREFVTDLDDPVSYYTIAGKEDEWESPLKDYLNDIKQLSIGQGHWNLFLVAADNVHDTQFHFVHKCNDKCSVAQTTLDEARLMAMYDDFAKTMEETYQLHSDMDVKYKPVGSKNIGVLIGAGTENNAFSLRISYSVITWEDRWTPIVVDMAKAFKHHFETPERQEWAENKAWKEEGLGLGKGDIQPAPKEEKNKKSKSHNNEKD